MLEKMKNNRFNIALITVFIFNLSLSAQDEPEADNGESTEMDVIQSSDLRGWSIGLRGMWLYDLESTLYDGSFAQDPRGLNGDNTNFDVGFEFYVEKQFTPFMGLQAAYRLASMTGATGTEYYANDFSEFRIGASLIWSNLDPNHVNSKWNFYNGVGASLGSFEAKRFLAFDDSENGAVTDNYNGMYVSGGIMYEVAASWRVELDIAYNIVRNDGFDGFDYATGWDPYLNVSVGLAYTFGDQEAPAMYAGNYYEAPYYEVARTKARINELEGRMVNLESAARRNDDKLKIIKAENEKRDQALVNTDNMLVEKITKLENGPDKSTIAPKAVVFFDFDSAELAKSAKEELLKNLAGLNEPLIVSAYTDKVGSEEYNAELRNRRAQAVVDFLTKELKLNASQIQIIQGDEMDLKDQFLSRRVEVR